VTPLYRASFAGVLVLKNAGKVWGLDGPLQDMMARERRNAGPDALAGVSHG
jgi:hypothetical protein